MPSLQAHMMNLVFRCMPQDKPGQPHDYEAERKRNDRRPPRPPKGVSVEEMALAGLPAEWITKAGNTKGVVFYIHGGGFTVGSARERRNLSAVTGAAAAGKGTSQAQSGCRFFALHDTCGNTAVPYGKCRNRLYAPQFCGGWKNPGCIRRE